MTGKARRLARFFGEVSQRTVLVPIDHALTLGPLNGLHRLDHLLEALVDGLADGVIAHMGVLKAHGELIRALPFMLQMSGSTNLGRFPESKVVVRTLDSAVRMGVDAVSIHVTVGGPDESRMLQDLGHMVDQCDRIGMPLLAMMYPAASLSFGTAEDETRVLCHLARMAQEVGADLVKIPHPRFGASLNPVVEVCEIPILVGGGAKQPLDSVLRQITAAMAAGASGVALGRNVFQRADVRESLSQVRAVVHSDDGRGSFVRNRCLTL